MLDPVTNRQKLLGLKSKTFVSKSKVLLVDTCPLIAKRMGSLITSLKQTYLGCVNDIHALERRITASTPEHIIINIATKGELDGYQIAKVLKLEYEIPFTILYHYKSTALRNCA